MIFKRTIQNSRQYKESEVMTIQLMKVNKVMVESAAYTVTLNLSTESAGATDSTVILNDIRELKEIIQQQRDSIKQFRET